MSRFLLAAVVTCVILSACGGTSDSTTTAAERRGGVDTFGIELFEERVVGANPGCVTCHSLEEDVTLVGPSLFAVESRVDGLTAAEYVRESIVDPDAYVVAGFVPGQMNPGWDDYLSAEQIESLVALLVEG